MSKTRGQLDMNLEIDGPEENRKGDQGEMTQTFGNWEDSNSKRLQEICPEIPVQATPATQEGM